MKTRHHILLLLWVGAAGSGVVSCTGNMDDTRSPAALTHRAILSDTTVYQAESAAEIFRNLTVDTVRFEDGQVRISSQQEAFPRLIALPATIEQADTHYVFIRESDQAAFRLTFRGTTNQDEARALRRAPSVSALTTPGAYDEEITDGDGGMMTQINAHLDTVYFFEELVYALRLANGQDVMIPREPIGQSAFVMRFMLDKDRPADEVNRMLHRMQQTVCESYAKGQKSVAGEYRHGPARVESRSGRMYFECQAGTGQ